MFLQKVTPRSKRDLRLEFGGLVNKQRYCGYNILVVNNLKHLYIDLPMPIDGWRINICRITIIMRKMRITLRLGNRKNQYCENNNQ